MYGGPISAFYIARTARSAFMLGNAQLCQDPKGGVGIEFRGMIPCPRRARRTGEGDIVRHLERPRHCFGFDGGCGVPVEVARVTDGC